MNPAWRRLILAFLIAPVVAPAAYAAALVALIAGQAVFGSASLSSIGGAGEIVAVVAAIGVPVAYAAALFLGAPIYLLLRRSGRATPSMLWSAGAAIGAAVAALLAPRLRGELFSIRFPLWAGILLGILSAEVFRRLLLPRNSGESDA
jgi:hypothetical protein